MKNEHEGGTGYGTDQRSRGHIGDGKCTVRTGAAEAVSV